MRPLRKSVRFLSSLAWPQGRHRKSRKILHFVKTARPLCGRLTGIFKHPEIREKREALARQLVPGKCIFQITEKYAKWKTVDECSGCFINASTFREMAMAADRIRALAQNKCLDYPYRLPAPHRQRLPRVALRYGRCRWPLHHNRHLQKRKSSRDQLGVSSVLGWDLQRKSIALPQIAGIARVTNDG